MARALVLTRWVQEVGLDGLPYNRFGDDFEGLLQGGEKLRDVTSANSDRIPPVPNVVMVEVECSDATLAAIKAHARFGAAAVLLEGDPWQSPVVTTGQYNALVTFLAGKFGASEAAVRGVVGATAAGRTRYEIATVILDYLRTRPKA